MQELWQAFGGVSIALSTLFRIQLSRVVHLLWLIAGTTVVRLLVFICLAIAFSRLAGKGVQGCRCCSTDSALLVVIQRCAWLQMRLKINCNA